MPGKLVVFSGLDGAGKSTQLDLLRSHLDAEGIEHVTFWSRGGYTHGMETAKTIVRRLSGRRILPPAGDSPARTKQLRRPWKRRLWLQLAIVDLWALYAIQFRYQMLRGRYVLADRYWQDSLLDFRLNFPAEKIESWRLWKCLVRSIPVPDHAFLLTIGVEESIRRGTQKNEPFPTPSEQLRSRAAYYEKSAGRGRAGNSAWQWLDGMRDPQGIADEVWTHVRCATRGSRERRSPLDLKQDSNPS
jgi:dTMP kinase